MNPETFASRRGFLRLATAAGASVILGGTAFGQQEVAPAPPPPPQETPGAPANLPPGLPARPGNPTPPPALYSAKPGGEMLIGPTEDLMREHAVQSRLLLIYDECGRRLREQQDFPPEVLVDAARQAQKFIEDYHERQEEADVFPRFHAGDWADLVNVLIQQHRAGRRMSQEIVRIASSRAFREQADRQRLEQLLREYARMYRPHMAREGSELFVALLNLLTPAEFAAMGQRFEQREEFLFGEGGYQRIVAHVGDMEKTLGIHDLAGFTPKG